MQPEELRQQLAALHHSAFGWAMVCCRRDRDLAADVLQQSYCRILDGRAVFGGRSKFSTWMFGVVRRAALEEIRRRERDAGRTGPLPVDETQDAKATQQSLLEQTELSDRLWTAMKQLSDRQREVLHLVYYEDLTVREAAAAMEISAGAASQHYQRGKDALRRLLAEVEVD